MNKALLILAFSLNGLAYASEPTSITNVTCKMSAQIIGVSSSSIDQDNDYVLSIGPKKYQLNFKESRAENAQFAHTSMSRIDTSIYKINIPLDLFENHSNKNEGEIFKMSTVQLKRIGFFRDNVVEAFSFLPILRKNEIIKIDILNYSSLTTREYLLGKNQELIADGSNLGVWDWTANKEHYDWNTRQLELEETRHFFGMDPLIVEFKRICTAKKI